MAMYQCRPALGASWNPTTFDGSQVLSLVFGDYDTAPPLFYSKLKFDSDAIFSTRLVGSPTSPRVHRRTGFGVKMLFTLTVCYETGMPTLSWPGSAAGVDSSLDAIAAILARSTGGTIGTPGAANPPYLFLSPNYESAYEQWFPVEIDASQSSPEITQDFEFGKNLSRTMTFPLALAIAFEQIKVAYQPYEQMFAPSINTLATVSAAPGGSPPFTATITLTHPLDPQYVVGDALLVWNPPFQWFDFTITVIGGGRTSITATTNNTWPSLPSNRFKIRKANEGWFIMPVFDAIDYSGAHQYAPGFKPLPNVVTLIS